MCFADLFSSLLWQVVSVQATGFGHYPFEKYEAASAPFNLLTIHCFMKILANYQFEKLPFQLNNM